MSIWATKSIAALQAEADDVRASTGSGAPCPRPT